METAPAIISNGAVWATTPLFAAAHLWSWHPLWAAGIWTAYGITALLPQGEALLKPLVESPLYHNFGPLRSTLYGRNSGSVIPEAPSYNYNNINKNKTTGISTTLATSTSAHEPTTTLAGLEKLTSVTTVNARFDSQPALIPTVQRDTESSPVSPSQSSDSVTASSSPVPNGRLVSTDSFNVLILYTSSVNSQPSVDTGLQTIKHAMPAVTSNVIVDSDPENSRYVKIWKIFDKTEIYGLEIRLLVSYYLLPAFLFWELLGFLWPKWLRPPNINTPRHIRKQLNHICQSLQQSACTRVRHWQIFVRAPDASRDPMHRRVGDFVWGSHRVPRAVACLITCIVGAYFLVLPLSQQSPLAGPAAHRDSIGVNVSSMALNCLWQFKICAIAAVQARLSPDGFHDTFPPPSSHTEVVCGWVFHLVMSFKTLGLVISNTALEVLELYSETVRASLVSLSDTERSILRFSRTASALSEPVAALVCQVAGCLPWISRSSGSICPVWGWQLNSVIFYIFTPTFLAAVITLSAFAFARCRVPRTMPFTRFPTILPGELRTITYVSGLRLSTRLKLFRNACLMLISMILLTWYLLVSSEQIVHNCSFIVSTAVILYCYKI